MDEEGKVLSARTGGSNPMADGDAAGDETFNPDKIPNKIMITRPRVESGLQVAMYHSEASYALRKLVIEQARKSFKELEKAEMSALLSHSHQRSKMLEDRFEDKFINSHGFGRGCQYTDPNQRITFKTFLQE